MASKKKQGAAGMPTARPVEPRADRPYVPGYGIPTTTKGLLSWSFAEERLAREKNYWVCTAGPGGKPHARPVWGLWVDGTLCFGGHGVRWEKNLAANPQVSIHLESGEEVVILEGVAELVTDPKDPLIPLCAPVSKKKYGMSSDRVPFWKLRPRTAFAWTLKSMFKDATRWKFSD
jgi:hypothetical protein